jgi:hypothetical protein
VWTRARGRQYSRGVTRALVPLLCLALAGPALAQEEPPPPQQNPENLEATQQARQHFMSGLEQFRAHDYREAIRSFSLAAQLVPSADLWFNIARAHEQLSEYDQSIEHYQRYLRDRVDPPDRAEVEAHIQALRERAETERQARQSRPTAGTLRLTANRAGARVSLDDREVGEAPWAEPREVEAGRHRLTLTREGYVPFRSEVSVEPGVTTGAYADLTPETRYRSLQNDPIFAWVVWGLGVGAIGASIGLAVHAGSLAPTDLDQARDWAAYSDGVLAAGIGLGVIGLILWFVEGRSVGTERITVQDEESPDALRGPAEEPELERASE